MNPKQLFTFVSDRVVLKKKQKKPNLLCSICVVLTSTWIHEQVAQNKGGGFIIKYILLHKWQCWLTVEHHRCFSQAHLHNRAMRFCESSPESCSSACVYVLFICISIIIRSDQTQTATHSTSCLTHPLNPLHPWAQPSAEALLSPSCTGLHL